MPFFAISAVANRLASATNDQKMATTQAMSISEATHVWREVLSAVLHVIDLDEPAHNEVGTLARAYTSETKGEAPYLRVQTQT